MCMCEQLNQKIKNNIFKQTEYYTADMSVSMCVCVCVCTLMWKKTILYRD